VRWLRRLNGAGKASVVASRLFEALPRHPVVTTTGAVKLLETTKPTAAKAIAVLEEHFSALVRWGVNYAPHSPH